MKFFFYLSEKYKDLQKSITDFFSEEKKDASFISFGLVLPITFFIYRYYLEDQ